MHANHLEAVAEALVAPGKGILAADESLPTITKRFNAVGIECTEQSRRDYRELLFSTPLLSQYISGVILFDETIRQRTAKGTPMASVLNESGMVVGIKVDKGTKPLANFPGEKITEGLDGLGERLDDYSKLGARFAKWRAVIPIKQNIPSDIAIKSNVYALARYAAICQERGIMPIVEPEVLMDGDHTLNRHFDVTRKVLQMLFQALFEHKVHLESILLKANMVLPGKTCPNHVNEHEIISQTRKCMLEAVPAAVPGIVFLSGGQSPLEATERLNGLNDAGATPWELSFSFGRALQEPVLESWKGKAENVLAAQAALLHRAKCNSKARSGIYRFDEENYPIPSLA